MSEWLSLLNGFVVSVFGSVLAASFCGALGTRRDRRIFLGCLLVLTLIQGLVSGIWSADVLRKAYPPVVHLPLLLALCRLTRLRLLPLFAVLSAYLCCQLRRWAALLIVAVFDGGAMMQDAAELLVTLPLLLVLLYVVAPVIRQLAARPVKIQLQYSVIPALYYLFDYAAVVYTDLLVSGNSVALEFMPFVCCLAYLIFLLYNSAAERERGRLEQLQKSLELQVRQSVREIAALRESQTLARRYRHDLRHHLQYVLSCIENGQQAQAVDYISGIDREIEAQKVQRYCENETVNLILSAFAERAGKDGIGLQVRGTLPAFVMVPDSDLCVILSNALENAIHACQPLAAKGEPCSIDVHVYEREGKLFLQVTNPCANEVRFERGLPVSERPEHGIGVQSICAVVQKNHGVCSFRMEDGRFVLRLSI